ncbi:DUF2207 domain-containing protein [Patescibacteria group bacterium]|nr:DUF2207 domain-containing protein [Patescibacteria group bacterium]
MRREAKISKLVLAAVFLLIFGLLPSSLQAQENQDADLGSIDNLNVAIEVLSDSSIKVEEEFEGLTLYSSSFVWQIDSKNFDQLEIKENGTKIDPKSINIQKGDLTRLSFPLSYYSSTNLKISYRSSNNLKIIKQKILLKNIIFNRSGLFINHLKVALKLPPDARESGEGQRFYAIHGIEESSQKAKSNDLLEYSAAEIGSLSSFTIEDSFVSSSLRFPLGQKIKFYFNNLTTISLVLISLPLPLLTLIFLFYLHLRYKNSVRIKRNLPPANKLPDEASPSLLDLLYQGEITESGVSATILDLIKKGVVIIVDKGEVITFGRKNTSAHLLSFEEKILGELFKQQKIKTNLKELKKIEEEELIDPIFEKVYHEIYQIGSSKGYFERNPYRIKILNHLMGIALFLLSIVLYVLAIIFFPANPLMLLPPFGITVASLLILYLARIIPPRTPAGKTELERWLSFKKYLLGHHPITDENNLALKYLPQAEALGATEEWIGHFKNLPTETPSFYVSASPYVATSEWMIRTVNACRSVAEKIEELKGY